MSELKTLKDLPILPTRNINIDELKAEAVKWQKKLEKDIGFVDKNKEERILGVLWFLEAFFNLDEKEVKE